MKKIYTILIIIGVFANTFSATGTSYTWTGNISTAWNTASNWSPSGVPGTGDGVHIYSGTYNPVLPANITINSLYMHSGTLDLNGDTLLLSSGTSTFSGGTITNGLLQLRGTTMDFNSTTFNVVIDAVVSRINLNGCTFNNYCYFETTTNVPGTGSGGAVFNDSVYLYHNYTGDGIWVMNNSTGHTFNGKLTIHNKGTKEITFARPGINVFNGDIVLINTGEGGILFGSDTLTAGHTISIGSGGFSAGDFNATNFYQAGNTPVSLTFTGTALPSITGATFGGDFSITSNALLFKNCTFNGAATFTATGSGSSSWYGGNKFNGNATFTNNASAGNLRLDADTANTYYADATFNGSRELRVCYGNSVSSFYGNITAASNTTFNAGTGTLCLAGSGTQSLSFGGSYPVKNLMLNKSGGSASLATALAISGSITFVKGNLTTTSSNLLTINNGGSVSGASDSSFIDGPVKKIGNAAFVFPTGKGNSYRAIGISAPSNTTDAFTGEYFNTGQTLGSSMDTTINTISSCNYWNLNRNTGSSNVTVKFQLDSTACDWNKPDSSHIGYWNGTKWVDKGVGVFDSIYIKPASAISNFGNFLFSYNLNHPTIGGLLNYAVVSNDSLILNDTLRVYGLSAARNINDVYKLIDSTDFTSNSSDVEALKLKIQSEKILMKKLSSTVLTAGQIVGQTLTSGVYKVNGSLTIDDFVILQGDTSSMFVFNISGNLNIINNCAVNLDGVRGYNVFFNVDSGITISGTTFLNGLFFADGNITVNDGFSGQAALYSLNKITINSNASVYSTSPQLPHLITMAACGLNYAQVTVNLHQRIGGPTQLGITQPTSLNFSLNNVMPMQAYLFFTLVSNGTPPNSIPFTLNTVNFNGNLRQTAKNATCWNNNYDRTASYYAAIPVNVLDLAGPNTISGLPVAGVDPNMDTDGACLFLIYRDQCGNNNQRAWGYISMDYGLALNNLGQINERLSVYTMPSFNPPFPVIYAANAFMLVGDYETLVSNQNLTINNTIVPINGTMFNFGAVGYNPNWPIIRYHSVQNGQDCGNLSLIGAYYSVRNTNLCSDFTLSATTVNSCQSSASGSIDLTVTPVGNYTYEWSNSATTEDLIGIVPGQYTVIVTNPNGCFHKLTVTVNPYPAVIVNISVQNSPPFCASNYPILSANLSSGTPPYTYQWYDSGGNPIGGATQSTYQVSGFGTYSVIVTDANGCTGSNSIEATDDPLNASINTTSITCHNQNNGSLTAMPAGSGITYLWSTGATTQTINNLSAGTYTVTVTQNGCTSSAFATITNPPALSVTISKNNVTCQGGNDGSATANPSGGVSPYTYLWSNSNTTANLTGLTTGTYTVTVTDANGCTATANTNIGFTYTLPPAPVITGGAAACAQNGTYTVTNVLAGATYQWSTSNSQSGSTSTATGVTFPGYSSESIIFTVTDINGCSNSGTFNIFACCSPLTGQTSMDISDLSTSYLSQHSNSFPFYTSNPPNNMINMGGWSPYQTNPVLIINGTFTVDENLTITTSEIILGPMARIEIDEGHYLALEACYLHACNEGSGYMWDGVYVNGTANPSFNTYVDIGTTGHSYVEDMLNGIVTNGYGHLEAPGCVFNKNYKTVQHLNCQGQNKSFMFGCTIECVDDVFAATPIPSNTLLAPFLNQRSFSGIEVNNIHAIDIGYDFFSNSSTNPPIYFYNLDNGILSLNSSADVRYCRFELITTNPNYSNIPYFGFPFMPSGLCIGANTLGKVSTFNVGTQALNAVCQNPAICPTGNTFVNSTNGIYLQGNINTEIANNEFIEITNGISPQFIPGYQSSAVASIAGSNLSVKIEANTFSNFVNGVNIINKRGSTININSNAFNKGVGTGQCGIMVERVNSPLPYFQNTVTIDRNEMHNITDAGIILLRERGAQVTDNNPINILAPTSPWPFRVKGISLINTSQCTVQGNRIATNLIQPASGDDNRIFGIEVQNTKGSNIASNHIEHTGRGIASLLNYTPQTLQCNNLDENYTGVWLFSSNIGDQLNGGTDQNNSWTLLGGPAAARGIVATGSTPSATWYYNSGGGLGSNQMSPGSYFPFISPSVPNTGCIAAPLRMAQSSIIDIINEQGMYDTIPAEEQYLAKKQVYYLLSADDSLMLQGTAEDTVLRTWYDSTAVANIGLFSSVADSIDANLHYAIAVNESIIPENHAEENEKAVNAIYLETWALDTFDFTPEQYEILLAVANETPLSGGMAVYAARVMLGLHIDDDYEGSGSRMAGNVKNQNSASSLTDNRVSLMPNPARDEAIYLNRLEKMQNGVVKIYNGIGIELAEYILHEGDNRVLMNLQKLTQGVYTVVTMVDNKTKDVRKLVVIR